MTWPRRRVRSAAQELHPQDTSDIHKLEMRIESLLFRLEAEEAVIRLSAKPGYAEVSIVQKGRKT